MRAAWAAEAAINRGPDGTGADEGEDGPALRACRAAFEAIIAQLQAANVPLRSLAKKGGAA